MFNWIKKLFGFGKEVKTEVKEVVKNTEDAKETLAQTISNFKEDVHVVEDKVIENVTIVVNAANKTKEELEKIVNERMSEIETKVTEVKNEIVAEVKKDAKVIKEKAKKVAFKAKEEAKKVETIVKDDVKKAKEKVTPKKGNTTKKGKN